MSLKSLPIPPVPEETARVAHAVFPHGNVFMQVRDMLGTIYTDESFADLFPTHGQPAFARLSPGVGDGVPIYGKLDGSASCRGRARSAGLEICPQLGVDGHRF